MNMVMNIEDPDLSSHGPIYGGHMPVFPPEDANEIILVEDHHNGTVTIYQERPGEPGQLDPATISKADYLELLNAGRDASDQRYADQA